MRVAIRPDLVSLNQTLLKGKKHIFQLQWRNYFVREHVGMRIGQGCHLCKRSCVRKEGKPEATLGERLTCAYLVNQKYTQMQKRGQIILISNLTKQVLISYRKSILIADVINYCAQKKTETVEYCLVSHHDSEIHAAENGNLERHEASKIEDRV